MLYYFCFTQHILQAFDIMGKEVLDEIKNDIEALRELLHYHIIQGNVCIFMKKQVQLLSHYFHELHIFCFS